MEKKYKDLFNQGKAGSALSELSNQLQKEQKLLKEQKAQKERLRQGQGGTQGSANRFDKPK